MFQLTNEEYIFLIFQNGISKNRGGTRKLSFAFTEQGIAMLSGILHSDIAVNPSIQIMNAFVTMRKYMSSNLMEQKYINNLVIEHDKDIKLLQESFKKFEEKKI